MGNAIGKEMSKMEMQVTEILFIYYVYGESYCYLLPTHGYQIKPHIPQQLLDQATFSKCKLLLTPLTSQYMSS